MNLSNRQILNTCDVPINVIQNGTPHIIKVHACDVICNAHLFIDDAECEGRRCKFCILNAKLFRKRIRKVDNEFK